MVAWPANQLGTELAEIRRVLAEIKGQLPSREDILQRTVIRAPIDGTVMNLRVNTETGVIGAGEPLLDIVPEGSNLIIDVRVGPTDIERIRPGMSARVVLTAYQQRNLPLIHGTLRSISADAMTDERTGSSYFVAKVEVFVCDVPAVLQQPARSAAVCTGASQRRNSSRSSIETVRETPIISSEVT